MPEIITGVELARFGRPTAPARFAVPPCGRAWRCNRPFPQQDIFPIADQRIAGYGDDNGPFVRLAKTDLPRIPNHHLGHLHIEVNIVGILFQGLDYFRTFRACLYGS
jgi:hypothetical protein